MFNRRLKVQLAEAEYALWRIENILDNVSGKLPPEVIFAELAILDYRKKWGGNSPEKSYCSWMCIFQKFIRGIKKMADIADNVIQALADLATLTAKVDALDAKVSAITPGTGTTVDLQPVLDKLDRIEAELTPTTSTAG